MRPIRIVVVHVELWIAHRACNRATASAWIFSGERIYCELLRDPFCGLSAQHILWTDAYRDSRLHDCPETAGWGCHKPARRTGPLWKTRWLTSGFPQWLSCGHAWEWRRGCAVVHVWWERSMHWLRAWNVEVQAKVQVCLEAATRLCGVQPWLFLSLGTEFFSTLPLPVESFLPRVSPWLAQRSVPVTTTKTLHPPQTAPPPPLSPPRPPLQTPPRAGRPPGPHSPPTPSSPSLPVRLTLLSTRPALCPLHPVPSRGASVVQE